MPHQSPRTSVAGGELPVGHGLPQDHRVTGDGILGPSPHPVTGMSFGTTVGISDADSVHHRPPFPKLEFPKFDGSNPRLWRDQCLMYFEVYGVHDSLKTRFAALNFQGAAAL